GGFVFFLSVFAARVIVMAVSPSLSVHGELNQNVAGERVASLLRKFGDHFCTACRPRVVSDRIVRRPATTSSCRFVWLLGRLITLSSRLRSLIGVSRLFFYLFGRL